MPTSKPRYQITDTGSVSDMLDLAEQRWPEVRDRKALLLQLAAAGAAELAADRDRDEAAARRARQREAFEKIRDLIDIDVLLSDDAWK